MDSSQARTQELWPVLKQRLDSARMRTILGGAGRIFHAPPDEFADPLGPEGTWWGRGVIVPTSTIWETESNPSLPRPIQFVLRFEFPKHPDYDPNVSLEAAHVEAFNLLQYYEPVLRTDGTPFKYMLIAEQIYRYLDPSDPYWDNDRGLWWSSTQYRLAISNKP